MEAQQHQLQPGTPDVAEYRPQPRYLLLAGAGLLAAALCGWSLWQNFDLFLLFFLAGSLLATFWFGAQLFSRIQTDDRSITLRRLGGQRRIEYRQLSDAGEAGRLIRGLVLLYHPLRDDGLVELDELRSLMLPAVENQEVLLQRLEERMPRQRADSETRRAPGA
ncbi:MAG: hypothetical protein H3C34_00460 [Caldilineaceae bacterium]|nr:hypothetical protein [Caldilineaceae bacterium]